MGKASRFFKKPQIAVFFPAIGGYDTYMIIIRGLKIGL